MDKLQYPITATTIFVIFYNALPWLGATDTLIVTIFAVAPLPVIWMIVRILKDGTPSPQTWDEYFYEDHAYRRNGQEETERAA